jgi:hypothetical protein
MVKCKACNERIAVVDENFKTRSKCKCGENIDIENVVGEELLEIGYECSSCIKKANKKARFLTKKPDSGDYRLISEIADAPIPFLGS